MNRTVLSLPPEHLARLASAYRESVAAKRRTLLLSAAILILLILAAAWQGEVNLSKLAANIEKFTHYIVRIFQLDNGAPVFSDIGEWFWGWKRWLRFLSETLLMAYIGTLLGAVIGFLLCFFACANLTKQPGLRFAASRFLEFCRTVPDLVYALIYVVAFGLGAMPGVLALASHTIGALGKQFADVVENIDMKPVEGVRASGGSWAEAVRYGALPQVLSNFISYTLLRFEINVRSAGVIGLVGAGGIGQEIMVAIRRFQYSDISALLIIVIVTVIAIDLITGQLRSYFLSEERAR